MPKRILSALVLTVIALGLISPATLGAQASAGSITILPIDRARLLVGQRFDFRVEANGLAAKPSAWQVTINGKTPDAVFGKQGQVTNASDKSQEQTFRDVALLESGTFTVTAKVTVGADTLTKSVALEAVDAKPTGKQAKNVILFVGDGLSLPMRTAARIVSKGMTQGKYNSMLEMDDMDYYAAVTTSGMDSIVTDSANAASAYATGNKTAVNAMGSYPDNTADPFDDPKVETIIELAKRTRGMSTGLVTTSEIQDATPAAMFTHTRRRAEYVNIMDQMLKDGQRADVIMGGGSATFLPKSVAGSRRTDERDLFKEFEKIGYKTVVTRSELNSVGTPEKLLGIFHTGNMNVYLDKGYYKKDSVLKTFKDQPMLWEMTDKALEILGKNPNGFFLMVEGASIDKQAHQLDWERTVWDVIEMDKSIGVAKKWAAANGNDTLIIVVADHSHAFSITGTYFEGDGKKGRDGIRTYELSQFPDYKDADKDGFPDNPAVTRALAIGWGNYPDYCDDHKVNDEPLAPAVQEGDKFIANKNRDGSGECRLGNLPGTTNSEVHTADDVPLTAMGPGAEQFRRTMDNTQVFFAMMNALGLDARKSVAR